MITLHLLGWLLSRKQVKVEKLQPLYTVGGNVKQCSHYGKKHGGSQKNRSAIDIVLQSHLWVYIQNNSSSWGDSSTSMFIEALVTIALIGKEPEWPTTDEWIKKTWYIRTMENYSATKKEKVLPFVTTGMDLKDIMLSKCKSQKDKYWIISLNEVSIIIPIKAQNRMVVSRRWEEGEMGVTQWVWKYKDE